MTMDDELRSVFYRKAKFWEVAHLQLTTMTTMWMYLCVFVSENSGKKDSWHEDFRSPSKSDEPIEMRALAQTISKNSRIWNFIGPMQIMKTV